MNKDEYQPIGRVLEAAVILAWPDLIAPGESGIVHVEYDFGDTGQISFLQIWLSQTRGVWHLVCSYFGSTFDHDGVQFENDYCSERLLQTLNSVIHHQDAFLPCPSLGRQSLLQISEPSTKEYATSDAIVQKALAQVKSDETPALV